MQPSKCEESETDGKKTVVMMAATEPDPRMGGCGYGRRCAPGDSRMMVADWESLAALYSSRLSIVTYTYTLTKDQSAQLLQQISV
jgi:hypothetical protein